MEARELICTDKNKPIDTAMEVRELICTDKNFKRETTCFCQVMNVESEGGREGLILEGGDCVWKL